jgi:lipooligosaccharide transport system permease protein
MTTGTLLTRVIPPNVVGGRRARYLLERNLRVYRRFWVVIFSGLFEPLFYLFAIGIGLGQLVGDVVGPDGQPVSYTAFVAPALLAASAMNGAVFESTFNVYGKLRWEKVYDAVLTTPLQPGDIALAELTWSQMRGGIYAVAFLVVMLAMGLVTSPWGLLAVPAALLIGFAFAGAGLAATTFFRSWQDFEFVTLVTLPLFLFSATFYPLDVYPPLIQNVAVLSPLYHGVVLIRSLSLGVVEAGLWGHVLFLAVVGLVGFVIASRRFGKLLLP